MLRTHTCGELNLSFTGQQVTLCGWVQRSRDLGGMTFIDLRDRYGITQLVFNMESDAITCRNARELGREYVIMVTGMVMERSNKNPKIPTGDIEVIVEQINLLNSASTPPFTIEDHTDGGDGESTSTSGAARFGPIWSSGTAWPRKPASTSTGRNSWKWKHRY